MATPKISSILTRLKNLTSKICSFNFFGIVYFVHFFFDKADCPDRYQNHLLDNGFDTLITVSSSITKKIKVWAAHHTQKKYNILFMNRKRARRVCVEIPLRNGKLVPPRLVHSFERPGHIWKLRIVNCHRRVTLNCYLMLVLWCLLWRRVKSPTP